MGATRVLLLVNSDPDGSGVGEIFLRSLVGEIREGQLVRLSTVHRRVAKREAMWLGFPSSVREIPMSAVPGFSTVRYWQTRLVWARRLRRDVERIVREKECDLLWAVLSSVGVIHAASQVTRSKGLNLVSTVWDPPEYLCGNLRLDKVAKADLLNAFGDLMKRSQRVSVMSEWAKEAYEERFGAKCIVWKQAVMGQAGRGEEVAEERKEGLVLVFAGTLYAKREWNGLVGALRTTGGVVGGRRVRVRFVGDFPRRGAERASFVEEVGRKPFEETVRTIRDADIAYLPYWRDGRHAEIVKMSFPSKLSIYVGAGTPILFHGPRISAAAEFLQRYAVGVTCDSLEGEVIRGAIARLAGDRVLRERMLEAGQRALEEELGLEVGWGRLRELLGIRGWGGNPAE